MLFWWICGGESLLPILLLRHLGSSPSLPHFWRTVLVDIGFLVGSVFILAYWIYQSTASGLQSFPWEVCWKFYWGSHVFDPLLLSWYFNVSLFVFWKFDYNTSCCSVTGLGPILCNPVDCSMSGLPVPHYFQEFVQVDVHWISDGLQPSYPLLPSSPFAFSLSQH